MASASTNELTTVLRLSASGILLVVLSSIALSIASYRFLPDQIRIHWYTGERTHLGPEYAATDPVLIAFPIVVIGLYLGVHIAWRSLRGTDTSVRLLYQVATFAALGILVGIQALLIALNLLFS